MKIPACVPMLSAAACASIVTAAGATNPHLRFSQEHGITFSEVGQPGNGDYTYVRFPGNPPTSIGGVDERYRIATTELSVTQWSEFVLAYAPFIGENYNAPTFKGGGHFFAGFGSDGVPQYGVDSELLHHPTSIGWRYAARYCNWLHNGKPTGPEVEQWVFETGAYDTSTFTQNPDGTLNDQRERSPGAQFFLPTLDEWVKAVHWDPTLNEGEGGWRDYAYGDTPPVSGLPGEGGQTNAGTAATPGDHHNVGSYPDWTTPWGLLDASGGTQEWMETAGSDARIRFLSSTSVETLAKDIAELDHIEHLAGASGHRAIYGFRIAALVPGPGAGVSLVLVSGILGTRRRR